MKIKCHLNTPTKLPPENSMQYRRSITANASYFFTINLAERKRTLLTQHIQLLHMAFHKIRLNHPFKINAIVILPDHLHMMMTLPQHDANYSLRINLIKSYFSRSLPETETISASRKSKRERGIWQRRYWEHFIRDDRDYEKHVAYIHYNPIALT